MANMKRKVPHIIVDAFPLVDDHFSGVGNYTLGIVQGFDQLAAEGRISYDLVVPFHRKGRLSKYHLQSYRKIKRNIIPNKVIRQFMKLHIPFPCDLFLGRGYYWFPSFLNWPLWFNKSGVVIHDITFANPETKTFVDKGNQEYLERVLPFSIKNANKILAVSSFTKKELESFYKIPTSKIVVTFESANRRLYYRRQAAESRKIRLKYNIFDEKYVLFLGNIEPRKNLERMIEAWMQVPSYITKDYSLILGGGSGWNNDSIKKKIQEAKEAGFKVLTIGQVPITDTPALFSGAAFYLFTPLYEGWGMSPMESYACGTPAVVSNTSSLPEAAGDAAIYCDPYSPKDIAAKIVQMLDKLKKDPRQFDERMEAHLSKYNWYDSAVITVEALTGEKLK